MTNIHQIFENPNGPMNAPVTVAYSNVNQKGYNVRISKRLIMANTKQAAMIVMLQYACVSLKPLKTAYIHDEDLIESMTYDFAKAATAVDISLRTFKTYMQYLVSHGVILKGLPYKSKRYIINPVYYNTFNEAQRNYYNENLKQMFPEIVL